MHVNARPDGLCVTTECRLDPARPKSNTISFNIILTGILQYFVIHVRM